jgi:hypothetical protein
MMTSRRSGNGCHKSRSRRRPPSKIEHRPHEGLANTLSAVELTPPLILSAEEAERGAIVVQAFEDAAAGKVPDAKLADFHGW